MPKSQVVEIQEVEEKSGSYSLTEYERETIVSMNDEDNKWWIYTSQQPMIRRLLKNPLFELVDKQFNKNYYCHPSPIAIEGYLPKKAITIRTKRKAKRQLTAEQRAEIGERLKRGRESK